MKAKSLFLLLVTLLMMVIMPGCNNSGQQVQAITAPIETTTEAVLFSVSNLNIKPIDQSGQCDIYNIEGEDGIIVSVTVTNNGSEQGSHEIILNIDWKEVETKSVVLAAGESIDVEFNLFWGGKEDGVYDVTIEGLQGIFGVG